MNKKLSITIFILLFSLSLHTGFGLKLRYKFKPGFSYSMVSDTKWNFYSIKTKKISRKINLKMHVKVYYRRVYDKGKNAKVSFRLINYYINGQKQTKAIPNSNITFTINHLGKTDLSKYSGSLARSYFFLTFPKDLIAPGRDSWKNFYYFYGNSGNIKIKLDAILKGIKRYKGRKVAIINMEGKGEISRFFNIKKKAVLKIKNNVYFDYLRGLMKANFTNGIVMSKINGTLRKIADFESKTTIK